MSFLELNTLQLISRNEGRIKSYESCFDLRAWSHDIGARNRYLKEWIRCDMPYAFVPLCAVTSVLRTMSCRSRGRVSPRCHIDCKSKVILDSICTSCHAVKQCFRNDPKFEKYFVEEELETSHWPCERCLEALKGIKMFWRVIIDKVFNINVSNTAGLKEKHNCCLSNSVRDVARMWQRDMIQQTVLVKTINEEENSGCSTKPLCGRKRSSCIISKMSSEGDRSSVLSRKTSKCALTSSDYSKRCSKRTCDSQKSERKTRCRCTSVRVKTFDACCNTITRSECEEIKAYRTNLEYIKKSYNEQSIEVKNLRNENCVLKREIQNMCNSCRWKSSIYRAEVKQDCNNKIALVPKPFEFGSDCQSTSQSAKDAESEMIITMKNCKNENFKHVSLLQVLHKTNEPLPHETSLKGPCQQREDPTELLSKVQTTLGAIFRREMTLSAHRKCDKTSDIQATFQSVTPSRSQSCASLTSRNPQTQCFLN